MTVWGRVHYSQSRARHVAEVSFTSKRLYYTPQALETDALTAGGSRSAVHKIAVRVARTHWLDSAQSGEQFDANQDDIVRGEIGDVELSSAAGKILGTSLGLDARVAFRSLPFVNTSHLGETPKYPYMAFFTSVTST